MSNGNGSKKKSHTGEMNRKKLEQDLSKMSSDLGFVLPKQVVAQPDFFAPLTATANRRELFSTIINPLQPRNKVHLIRKQIFASKLKQRRKTELSDNAKEFVCPEKDKVTLMEEKIALENKKEKMREEIQRKIDLFRSKSIQVQTNVCKLAEKEKLLADSQEKKVVFILYKDVCDKKISSLNAYIENIQNCLKPSTDNADAVQAIAKMWIRTGCQETGESTSKADMSGTELSLWADGESVLVGVVQAMQECLRTFPDSREMQQAMVRWNNTLVTSKTPTDVKRLKLAVVNDWLQAQAYKAELEVLQVQKTDSTRKLLRKLLLGNPSMSVGDFSFLDPSDFSNTGSNVEVTQILNLVKLRALNKRLAGLLQNVDVLSEKHKTETVEGGLPNEGIEENKWELLQQKVSSLKSKIHSEVDLTRAAHNSVVEICLQVAADVANSQWRMRVDDSVSTMQDLVLAQADVILNTPLDALRKVTTVTGKKVLALECDEHRFNPYRGDCPKFFATTLLSPYHSMDHLRATLQARTEFTALLREMQEEPTVCLYRTIKPQTIKVENVVFDRVRYEEDLKKAVAILALCRKKIEKATTVAVPYIQKILRNWREQPYRRMIADVKTVDGLTLPQYEAMFTEALKDRAFYRQSIKT